MFNPPIAIQNKIPMDLADDIYYPALKGTYTKPVPTNATACVSEANKRAMDVLSLISAIHANNAEMNGIRQLNDYSGN